MNRTYLSLHIHSAGETLTQKHKTVWFCAHGTGRLDLLNYDKLSFLFRIIFRPNSDHTLPTPYNVLHLPDVHTMRMHRGSLLGQLLDWSGGNSSTCRSQHHDRADHQLYVRFRELQPSTRVLPQGYRLLFTNVFWIHIFYSGGVRVCPKVFQKDEVCREFCSWRQNPCRFGQRRLGKNTGVGCHIISTRCFKASFAKILSFHLPPLPPRLVRPSVKTIVSEITFKTPYIIS